MKNRLNEARLNELLPEFDKDVEWDKLAGKLEAKKPQKKLSWKLAATLVALMAATSIIALVVLKDRQSGPIANNELTQGKNWSSEVTPELPAMHTYASAETPTATKKGTEIRTVQPPNEINNTAPIRNKMPGTAGYKRTEEFICNGTPCPLEICIIQTIRCKDKAPSAIATCNTLEPDQARQLHYRSPEAVGGQCRVTVDEIRIRRVTTGETIVLNAHSQPSTAQELFNCITGKEKCNLLAGIFESDCNDQQRSHGLKIDNSMGSLIME
ncbi:MAG: hypothetical protein KF744_06245 [Taibaiella sp.]|nr:hypothetical protein [Taibaiella sp.]